MSARLEAALQPKTASRAISRLVTYVMIGDPSIEASIETAVACANAGAAVLELGVPFSDPVADGPIIAAAGARALERGARIDDVFAAARAIRARTDVPIVLMGYANPFHRLGYARAAERAADAGVDALLVPDMPLEASRELGEALRARSLAMPLLIAPTTPPGRAKAIAEGASGFVYFVSLTGVTGRASPEIASLKGDLARVRAASPVPLVTGFGLRTREQIAALRDSADGLVVGSAIVDLAARTPEPHRLDAISNFVRSLVSALDPKEP